MNRAWWVSVRMGRKTIADLLDAIPRDLIQRARARILAVPGVKVAPRVRMRRIGGSWFSDVVIQVDPALTLEQAHAVADAVELCLGGLMPGGDVVVHAEPAEPGILGRTG